MRVIMASVLLVFIAISPAYSAQASLRERMAMSQSIADYIHDPGAGTHYTNPFKAKSIEVGAAAIEWTNHASSSHYALADWRSADGTLHGQVYFFYVCDAWNVAAVSVGHPFTAEAMNAAWPVPTNVATNLINELAELGSQHIAYLRPAVAGVTC